MSADVTAMLFYGFPLPTLKVDSHDLNDEWCFTRRPKQPEDKSDYKTPEWDRWREQLRRWESTPEYVRIDFCGSEQSDRDFIHCPCMKIKVEWNEVQKVSAADLIESPEAEKCIHEFCDQFNLPKRPAGWYLAARYF